MDSNMNPMINQSNPEKMDPVVKKEGLNFTSKGAEVPVMDMCRLTDADWQQIVANFSMDDYWYIATYKDVVVIDDTDGASIRGSTRQVMHWREGGFEHALPIFAKLDISDPLCSRRLRKPTRKIQFLQFLVPMLCLNSSLESTNPVAFDLSKFYPHRNLPTEGTLYQCSIFFCGYYFANCIEKIMYQVIVDEDTLHDRLKEYYGTIAIVSALMASFAISAYFSGLTENNYTPPAVNSLFGFTALGSSVCSLISMCFATIYYIVLLGTPSVATDEFIVENISILGIPAFMTCCGTASIMLSTVISAYPTYGAGLLALSLVFAVPSLLFVIFVMLQIGRNALVVALDELLAEKLRRVVKKAEEKV